MRRRGKAVDKFGIRFAKAGRLSAKFPLLVKHLEGQVFFKHSFYKPHQHISKVYLQPVLKVFNLSAGFLSPLCTGPMKTTNLIKE